jgi:hypothetical protein
MDEFPPEAPTEEELALLPPLPTVTVNVIPLITFTDDVSIPPAPPPEPALNPSRASPPPPPPAITK